METIIKLIIFLPLISAFFNGFFNKKLGDCLVKWVAGVCIIIPTLFSFYLFSKIVIDKNVFQFILSDWINIGNLGVNWLVYVDQITAIMFLLVTSVSAVVHIYSLGYMKEDKTIAKFLSYLSLFTFFMLMLVCSGNFVQLFLGWEGVGLCSYLLIGYYSYKDSANKAAIKAFIVNRISDFAFISGIALIIIYTGRVNFSDVFASIDVLLETKLLIFGSEFVLLNLVCLLLFIGCMGKSAQLGMHVWLPDAMEGPTPVSALIHAATMVTAGVFLLVRCSFLFEHTPIILNFIAIIGAVTCLFAALIAIAQSDIKKIIAYSTCSQLGYMFFACGVSAYQAAMFHLVTHGFFKALLFLSAGNIIYVTGQQDLFKMGGLRKKMPVTYMNFCIGSLAIIGVYPFAGFYSKDLILESAYSHGGVGSIAFIFGIVAAFLTAIYSLKIIILTFHGKTKINDNKFDTIKEAPCVMNLPLILLTCGALFSGMIGYYILDINNPYGLFIRAIYNKTIIQHHKIPLIVETLPLIVGLFGILIGYYIYIRKYYEPIIQRFKYTYCLLSNKFFVDEIYQQILIKPVNKLAHLLRYIDTNCLDRFGPNGAACVTRCISRCICRIQTGYIYNYAFYIVLALVLYLTFVVLQFL